MSEQETGKCDVCGEMGVLLRKYYYYNIPCDCCGGSRHFELVRHHKNNCKPRPPRVARIVLDIRPDDEDE